MAKKRWIMALTRQMNGMTKEHYLPGQCYESERSRLVLAQLEKSNGTIVQIKDIEQPFASLSDRQLNKIARFWGGKRDTTMIEYAEANEDGEMTIVKRQPTQDEQRELLIEHIEVSLAEQGQSVLPEQTENETQGE